MRTTTMRISLETHNVVCEMADQAGVTMQQIVEEAVEAYRRRRLLEAINKAYTVRQNDYETLHTLDREMDPWDVTLAVW